MKSIRSFWFVLFLLIINLTVSGQSYKNFRVAVYCRAQEVQNMGDTVALKKTWDELIKQVHIGKVYIETHRDGHIVDEKTLRTAIKFFKDRGVQVSGGITYTVNEANNFQTYCYSKVADRQMVKHIAEYTARFFNEIILDDFFFTNCKCDSCIKAKGNRSWTDFRLALMKDAAENLVIKPAKAVNPNVQVVIKYPNWYEHFQGLGFNLKDEPPMFDGIYTGTETRNRSGNQHLQQYLGYNIFRYFENIKPGQNRGGWVDTGGGIPYDRYAEQLWLTLFAKAPEMTLFDFRQMQSNLRPNGRAPWQESGDSFDFDEMEKPVKEADGTMFTPTKISRVAGYTFEKVDRILGQLGNPVGIKSYKPYNSVGEDFLQNYIGMIGIPIEMVPEFPEDEDMVFLTETAKYDPQIVQKIEKQLVAGKNVTITSGLYKALEGKGIEDIVELRVTDRKANVKEFSAGFGPTSKIDDPIIIPEISYLTNDSWEVVSALDDTNGWPILHRAGYSKGQLYVLTIPDNFIDLYNLPPAVLNRLRQNIAGSMNVVLEGPGQVSLFEYDNNSCIVESFLDKEVTVNLVVHKKVDNLTDLETGEKISGTQRRAFGFGRRAASAPAPETYVFEVTLKPHSYKAFKY